MKKNLLISCLFTLTILFFSCQKEAVKVTPTMNEDDVSFVSEEVISDLNFTDLLDEGDDGTFWGDNDFMNLKSAAINDGTCPARTVERKANKKTVTLEYSGGDCGKSGTIIIEYFKPNDGEAVKKKNITYVDFIRNGITFNGEKSIVKSQDNYNISAEIEIGKLDKNNDSVQIVRKYKHQVKWLCGLDTKDIRDDNIKTVTGSTEVTRTVNGEESSYSRKILSPLLVVMACPLKIQAGSVKIEKPNGAKITINYGDLDHDIDCGVVFTCGTTFEVTKGDKTYTMELIDGKRVRQVVDTE